MADLVWTEPALKDLQEIAKFIATDSSVYAARVAQRLLNAPKILQEFPLLGQQVPELGRPDIRELLCGSYRVIYRHHDGTCHVLTIVHASRDFLTSIRPGEWIID